MGAKCRHKRLVLGVLSQMLLLNAEVDVRWSFPNVGFFIVNGVKKAN